MSVRTEEVNTVEHNTVPKKVVKWTIGDTEYKIVNIPYQQLDADEEEFIDLDVAIKMDMIRELMAADRIPNVVDFEKVKDLKL